MAGKSSIVLNILLQLAAKLEINEATTDKNNIVINTFYRLADSKLIRDIINLFIPILKPISAVYYTTFFKIANNFIKRLKIENLTVK